MGASGGHDIELLQRSQSGEEAAFMSLYRRWQGAIYRYALRLTGSVSVAEDVTQDVFLALVDRPSGFDSDRGTFSAYLYGIARHHVLRRIARESLFVPMLGDAAESSPYLMETRHLLSNPLYGLALKESIDLLYGAVAALPLRYREVVVLCELQELSYTEAAQVIGCPEGTIRSRLHRARILLYKKIQEMTRGDLRAPRIEPARCAL